MVETNEKGAGSAAAKQQHAKPTPKPKPKSAKRAKVKIRNRLDLKCKCKECGFGFTMYSIDKQIPRDTEYDLGTLACPTCGKKNMKFTLHKLRVSENALAV